jgi:hypothetical protein
LSFTNQDILQIETNGLNTEKVNAQIKLFINGIPPINLKAAATINNGILCFNEHDKKELVDYYESQKKTNSIIKFVPSSGAASRMFKFLFKFISEYDPKKETLNSYINKNNMPEMTLFLFGKEKLPFYSFVKNLLPKYYKGLSESEKVITFAKTLLDDTKLNFGEMPKGLLPFHQYKNEVATAFQEHLFEAALYAAVNNKAKLHFTISEKHQNKFEQELNRIQEHVSEKTNCKFDITFSFQKKKTNTIAVTPENNIFRENDQSLLFRPSGHGALIENLNEINDDIIFIKNIDNVVAKNLSETVAENKKMLGGLLLKIQNETYKHQELLENSLISEEEIIAIANFLINTLNVVINPEFEKYSRKYQIQYLTEKLNRPIRVCGMVKNEGEPGGGPFWVKSESGATSLQIVESAQIDLTDKTQKNILNNATHFNPVDLVCSVKNFKGEKYNLLKFVDPNTGFISSKTKLGKDLKALEVPGLWNGAMANWNTVFVEVPLKTFNPVKTVNDLLKPAHQA